MWPPIANEKTLARLAMDDAEFSALSAKLATRIGGRRFAEEDYQRAIGYPWARPQTSFLYAGDRAVPLGDSPAPSQLERAESGRSRSGEPLHPLLTIGSNGSPEVLATKLAGLPPDQREVLVICGELAGHDVAFSPHLAVYGALPATIVRSPGVRVRAALLWVTIEQLEALTWTEFNYLLARLPGDVFLPDDGLPIPPELFLYVSRHGALRLDAATPAIEAFAAAGRSAAALSQAAALDRAAGFVLGASAVGRELVKRTIEDYRWAAGEATAALREHRVPLDRSQWDLMTPPRR